VEVAALETSNLILDECGHRGSLRLIGERGLRASADASPLSANASVALVRGRRGFLPLHFRRPERQIELLLRRRSEGRREQVRANANERSAAGRTPTLHRFAQLSDSPGLHVATVTAPDFVCDVIGPGGCEGRGGDYGGGQGGASSWGCARRHDLRRARGPTIHRSREIERRVWVVGWRGGPPSGCHALSEPLSRTSSGGYSGASGVSSGRNRSVFARD